MNIIAVACVYSLTKENVGFIDYHNFHNPVAMS